MAVKVFFHICAITRAEEVVCDMVRSIHFSGLYDAAETIYCYISGEQGIISRIVEFLRTSGDRFVVVKIAPGDISYERLTLEDIHNHVSPEDKILYIHSKGVSCHHQGHPEVLRRIDDWNYVMLYYLVRHYKFCIDKLDNCDAVGVNYIPNPAHFSGNFWWVRGDYFLTLPTRIGNSYFDPEIAFLCVNNPRIFEIYSTKMVNLYEQRYEPFKYIDSQHY